MGKIDMKKAFGILSVIVLFAALVMGCGQKSEKQVPESNLAADNVIITETGEVLEKEGNERTEEAKATATPESATPEIVTPEIELAEPEQEQVITEEDQIEPRGNELQLVFLGDSIFDNSRDGTGIPYLTAVQCEADVYNLAIGGTSASIEMDESGESAEWTSRSLVGIVNAIMKKIPADIFEGTRTKEILDNPKIDFSQTDYFIIEYGINDFFRGVAQNDPDNDYNIKTYAGALRYAVSNLSELAPDATIILCSPTYAQFYNGTWMIGDGNSLNTGNGTLFDYKGTCNYVANETQSVFFNAYQDLGIDGYTAEAYLEDGVHLTEAGRQLYADALAKVILNIEETKNN